MSRYLARGRHSTWTFEAEDDDAAILAAVARLAPEDVLRALTDVTHAPQPGSCRGRTRAVALPAGLGITRVRFEELTRADAIATLREIALAVPDGTDPADAQAFLTATRNILAQAGLRPPTLPAHP